MKVNLEEESRHLKLGDVRRSKRFVKIVSQLVNNPESSICERSYSWPDIKGAYRFLSNKKVKEISLAKAIRNATRERCLQNEVVLCVQDTTNAAFASSAKGLGYLDHGKGTGMMVHNILAIDSRGCPLGILHQNMWSRKLAQKGKAKNRQHRVITQKESNRWLKGVTHCEKELADCKKIVTVADREADIYELFAKSRTPNSELLIRAVHNRKTLLGNIIWEEIAAQEVIAQFDLEIGNPLTAEIRIAKMSIRTGMVLLAPPTKKPDLPAIIVYGLLVREEDACDPKQSLEWKLISSMPVETDQMAVELVKWYSYRWRIERFHYILKSGCRLEHSQLRSLTALRKVVLTYSLSAYKLMQLLYESRIEPEQPCTNYLSEQESQVIYAYQHKVKLVQKQPLSISKAVWLIARMGGYIGRNSDGPPGIKTLWKGLQKLHTIMQVHHVIPSTYPQNSFG